MIIKAENTNLTISLGLGVPGRSVLRDLASTSENDPDRFLAVNLAGTFNMLTREFCAILRQL